MVWSIQRLHPNRTGSHHHQINYSDHSDVSASTHEHLNIELTSWFFCMEKTIVSHRVYTHDQAGEARIHDQAFFPFLLHINSQGTESHWHIFNHHHRILRLPTHKAIQSNECMLRMFQQNVHNMLCIDSDTRSTRIYLPIIMYHIYMLESSQLIHSLHQYRSLSYVYELVFV